MMKLLSAPPSPFGRKVKIVAKMKGLWSQIELENVDTSKPDNPELARQNPLLKIPVLILSDGTRLYDSKVICEYLDTLKAAPVLFPSRGMERFETLTLGALADGVMEAALALVYEKRFRPEDKWVASWMDRQQAKIDSALAHLEAHVPNWQIGPNYGHVALACALGYLDLRHEGRWRANHPALTTWLDRFAASVPAFAETRAPG